MHDRCLRCVPVCVVNRFGPSQFVIFVLRKKALRTSSLVAETIYFQPQEKEEFDWGIFDGKRSLKPKPMTRSPQGMHVDRCSLLVQVTCWSLTLALSYQHELFCILLSQTKTGGGSKKYSFAKRCEWNTFYVFYCHFIFVCKQPEDGERKKNMKKSQKSVKDQHACFVQCLNVVW